MNIRTLFLVIHLSLPMLCLTMDEQTITITDLPQELVWLIGQFAARNNVKDVFRFTAVSKKLQAIFSKKDLTKLLTFERIIKAMPYDQNGELANQVVDRLQIERRLRTLTGAVPLLSLLVGDLHIPIHSVLNYSIYMGQHTLTNYLLEAGELYDDQSFLVAIAVNNIDAVKLLLEYGANPAKRFCLNCLSPMAWATCACGTSYRFTPLDFARTNMSYRYPGHASDAQEKLHKDINGLLGNSLGKRFFTECQYIYQLWSDSNDKKFLDSYKIPLLAVGVAWCALCYSIFIRKTTSE